MIPIVEDYLSELIQSKLTYLKTNPSMLGKILGTSQTRIDRLKTFIQSTPIKVTKGYPRTAAELPSICILLSGEGETQVGLGDYANSEELDIRTFTEELTVTSIEGGRMAVPYIETTYKPLVEITQVVHNQISSILHEDSYDVAVPDLGLVGFYDGSLDDGDTVTVTYTYRATSTDLTEVLYESNYRLEVWANNGDLVVELYHLLKWALLSGRDSLIADRDIVRQRLGGADFEPAPNYFPEFVYRRALTFWCQFTVSTPVEEVPYITGVTVNDTISFGGE